MRSLQEEKLSQYREKGIELDWTDKIDDISPCKLIEKCRLAEGVAEDYTMLVAHEFFDAMPINLFEVCLSIHPRNEADIYRERKKDGEKFAWMSTRLMSRRKSGKLPKHRG